MEHIIKQFKIKLDEFVFSKKWAVLVAFIALTWGLVEAGEVQAFHAWIATGIAVGLGVYCQAKVDERTYTAEITHGR